MHITLLAGIALDAGCHSNQELPSADPPLDGGLAPLDSSRDGGDTRGDAGSTSCQTPAAEDLLPHIEFFVDGGFQSVPPRDCNAPPPPDGEPPPPPPPPPGDAGEGGGGQSGGPGDGENPPRDDFAPAQNPILSAFRNELGQAAQHFLADTLDPLNDGQGNRPLGKNGRQCESCHADDNQWTITPAFVQRRFQLGESPAIPCKFFATNDAALSNSELEPVFRLRDGANSPRADVSTPEQRTLAYSQLLNRALIRIGIAVPPDADFELVSVEDPYGFASANELSLFRRSPMMANLRFNTTVMWDGRETASCGTLTTSLRQQAKNAITGHAEGDPPPDDAISRIVHTEIGIYIAQFMSDRAGQLNIDGAHGGPTLLAKQPFYWGINAFDKTDPQGHRYSRDVFELYRAWRNPHPTSTRDEARAQIAEGERIYNERTFVVRQVSGFNDELRRKDVPATCGSCHNTPNVGTNSEGRLMDIGVSDAARRSAEMPLYTFRNKQSGVIRKSTDPGQALATKQWVHMNRFKVPGLRSLAGRAPYLHDGSAPTLDAVVEYHDRRFEIRLTPSEKAALTAFLGAL